MDRNGFLLLLLLSSDVICQDCVVFNFENNITEDFRNDYGMCLGFTMWNQNQYSTLLVDSPSEKSTSFISPKSTLDCMSSYPFSMSIGWTVEVKVYMESAARSDHITVIAYQYMENGMDATVGMLSLSGSDPNLTRGWQRRTIRIQTHIAYFNGYISLLGSVSSSSIVLIDLIRYFSPTSSEELCPFYKEDIEVDMISTTENLYEVTLQTNPETTTDLEKTPTSSPDITTDSYSEAISTVRHETTVEYETEVTSTAKPKPTHDYLETTPTHSPDITTENYSNTISTANQETTNSDYLETTTSSPDTTTDNYSEATTPKPTTENPDTDSTNKIVNVIVKILASFRFTFN